MLRFVRQLILAGLFLAGLVGGAYLAIHLAGDGGGSGAGSGNGFAATSASVPGPVGVWIDTANSEGKTCHRKQEMVVNRGSFR